MKKIFLFILNILLLFSSCKTVDLETLKLFESFKKGEL